MPKLIVDLSVMMGYKALIRIFAILLSQSIMYTVQFIAINVNLTE